MFCQVFVAASPIFLEVLLLGSVFMYSSVSYCSSFYVLFYVTHSVCTRQCFNVDNTILFLSWQQLMWILLTCPAL